ncbi:MAG: acyltransferase family protein, partial [Alphaproteobacteria bacterium]
MGDVTTGRDGSGRLAAIDVAKGLAALWVLLIHAGALEGEPLMVYLFNRAAPLFVVLMGLNAGLWWRRRGSGELLRWWTGRARRLYPPMWQAVAAFWAIAIVAPQGAVGTLGWKRLARNLLGWLEGVGTGWFVTLAIEFAILMPLLVLCVRRLGPRRAVALSVLVTAACFALRFPLVGRLGTFGWFVFPPRLLANVVFGIVLAPVVDRLGAREMLVAALACVGYFALPAVLGAASPWQPVPEGIGLSSSGASAAAYRLLDLPVSVLLLGASGVLAAVPVLGAALDWLGVRSYGVYLGQMVAHNAVALLVGTEAFRARFGPSLLVAVLLAGALGWIAVTDRAAAILASSRPGRAGRLVAGAVLLACLGHPVVAAAGSRRPLVLLVGDSTTAGMCEGCPPSPAASPATAIEALRSRLPAGSRWRDLRAVSAGVGGSTTSDWLAVNPDACRFLALAGARGRDPGAATGRGPVASPPTPAPTDLGARALAAACTSGGGLAAAVRRLLG